MAVGDAPSSPPSGGWANMEEELSYYKSQYETLEVELQEFQTSSKELEAELEKDVEESEKRERRLQEKAEKLGFEVDEWKTKYKQSKTEANNAQNTLQKEITALRDGQRNLQLKLRDTEVQNDDFERQARNQSSSLEDLESKYNVAIERSVMLEEEIKIGEQERENLRIQCQRLRDELSDLKIEAEIQQEKLRIAQETIEVHHQRKTSQLLASDSLRPRSPISDTATSATDISSPTAASTPPSSKTGNLRTDATPPSPPLSDASITARAVPSTPMPVRKGSIALDPTSTPRPGIYQTRPPRHSRGPSVAVSTRSAASGRTTPSIRTTAPVRSRPSISGSAGNAPSGLPRSGSLYQIRGLIGKMQKLEERVYSARSKLPAPTHTPPRASPRNGSALGHYIPSTVTVRSNRKRSSQISSASGVESGVGRLSFGVSGPAKEPSSSRPSSRASAAGQRPGSRSSIRTPLGHYSTASVSVVEGRIPRPRSSMSGQSSHGHSHSVSVASSVRDGDGDSDGNSATPIARRLTIDRSSIPTPSGLPRRQSQGRRTSSGVEGDMGPPLTRPRKMSEIGESY
ncbi:nuclear distribution protein nude [Aaosphaeria arxii CBS 175.79]|uniref:Nuclear distribution protein nude n=1 Tax=Aaosphaeria arxii CBS 175.79 TaxID=1450172 RepID=A0A6A5Y3J3_9PLEO|nr:nuclear distribution protein nude [Aaosphaeria arxii CBS 175.79]KAF2019849.1 nuclear distribution protein nude [Aaosphaeria arxii CBS 175.79]